MIRFMVFALAGVLLVAAPPTAAEELRARAIQTSAEDQACRFAEWGFGYFKVREKGEEWTYVLDVPGPKWRHMPYGYHAPGHLSCESCGTDPAEPGGVYAFGTQANLSENALPRTAAARVAQRFEMVGYPGLPFLPDDLAHVDSREGVRFGPLSGYAVLYRLIARREGEPRRLADVVGREDRGLLVISLTDDCVGLEVSFFVAGFGDGQKGWAVLDALTAEAVLRKVRGAAAPASPRRTPGHPMPYGAIVRNPAASTPTR